MKPNDIVKYNEKLGLLIMGSREKTKDRLLFLPVRTGRYHEENLEIVTESQVSETTLIEKVEYLKQDFIWGYVVGSEVINMGEYIIFSYKDRGNNILYHTYLNFDDTNRSYYSLDSALIGLLDYKYQGANSHAGLLIERMFEMPKYEDEQLKPR